MSLIKKFHQYAWLSLVLLSLLPLWSLGIFHRGLWTPDEPREADIAWRMSQQADRALPELAGSRFLEKPPLTYWVSAFSQRLFGHSVAALRAPNLLYALATTLAVGLLAFQMAGRRAGAMAALITGSAFESLRVQIWLAPDACLLAGCAIALLGLYRGYTANTSGGKLGWYSLMHCGALIGFMAKSAVGWIVPGMALLLLVAWEKRWRELLAWQLWIGFAVQAVAIGAWVGAVLNQPDGLSALRILFWNNLAGRFAHIAANGAPDYASAHQNWPGKYLSELPYYLFPWTLLIIPALQRAWRATRQVGSIGTAWRFAVTSWLPFFALLSCATTARDVYFAPAMVGIGVMMGLWLGDLERHTTGIGLWSLRGTRYLLGLLPVAMGVVVLVLGFTDSLDSSHRQSMTMGVGGALLIFAVAGSALSCAASAQRRAAYQRAIAWSSAALLGSLIVGLAMISPVLDKWQNLAQIAVAVERDVGSAKLALLVPDETTIAMMDYHTRVPFVSLEGERENAPRLAADWFYVHNYQSRLLVLLPGSGASPLSGWLQRFRHKASAEDGVARTLERAHIAHVVARYELPQGRRYALLAPTVMLRSGYFDD